MRDYRYLSLFAWKLTIRNLAHSTQSIIIIKIEFFPAGKSVVSLDFGKNAQMSAKPNFEWSGNDVPSSHGIRLNH